jgi:uncharacterized protein YndB with AHSA1/START domain
VTRSHAATEDIAAAPARVFEALLKPADIRVWWSASNVIVAPREGGLWVASWGADEAVPDYVTAGEIAVVDPPKCLVLSNLRYCATLKPLPFDATFSVEFTVLPIPTGARLRVVQKGFPADPIADEYLAACETGWQNTLASIKAYLERA